MIFVDGVVAVKHVHARERGEGNCYCDCFFWAEHGDVFEGCFLVGLNGVAAA
jgi:hypothetical protein